MLHELVLLPPNLSILPYDTLKYFFHLPWPNKE